MISIISETQTIMNLATYKGKGYTGLNNLGNTCFLNSCLQVLNHTYELHEILDKKGDQKIKSDLIDASILVEWNDLRKVMWSGNGVVSPNKFVHNVHKTAAAKKKDIFTGYAQNDMPEFLLFMIDCMHNSTSRSMNMRINGNARNHVDEVALRCYGMLKDTYSKEYSEILELFYGIYISQIESMDGGVKHVIRPESYFILDLPILMRDGKTVAPTLYECFKSFVEPEYMTGDNAWFNEKTGQKEDVRKSMTFWNFPKILVIVLKRFTPDGQAKMNNMIDIPIDHLDLSAFVRGYNPASYVYELFGICNHFGGVTGGHYTAFVRNAENKWLHMNDEKVEIVDNPASIVTPMAYCLFYRKK